VDRLMAAPRRVAEMAAQTITPPRVRARSADTGGAPPTPLMPSSACFWLVCTSLPQLPPAYQSACFVNKPLSVQPNAISHLAAISALRQSPGKQRMQI
jgi:hypothetical protein